MKRILFQGDSITDTNRNRNDNDSMGYGYTHLVAASLGLDNLGKYEFYNRGVSGDRIIDVLARVKRDIINIAPDYMSILVGVNDVWHEIGLQNGVSAEMYEFYYDLLINQVKEALPNIRIMIMEPYVLKYTATEENWEIFDAEVKKRAVIAKHIAEKHGLLFVPLQDKLNEAASVAGIGEITGDGVHPNAKGHELIKREWLCAFDILKATEKNNYYI